jgi:hypothetical protein
MLSYTAGMGGTELRLSSTALMATTSMTVAKHWSKKRTGSVDLYRSVGYVAKIPAVGRLFSSSGLEIQCRKYCAFKYSIEKPFTANISPDSLFR